MVTINENAKLFNSVNTQFTTTSNVVREDANTSIFDGNTDEKVSKGEEVKKEEASNEIPWWKFRAKRRARNYEKNKKIMNI